MPKPDLDSGKLELLCKKNIIVSPHTFHMRSEILPPCCGNVLSRVSDYVARISTRVLRVVNGLRQRQCDYRYGANDKLIDYRPAASRFNEQPTPLGQWGLYRGSWKRERRCCIGLEKAFEA